MAGSAVKDRIVYPLQARVINPIVMLAHDLGFPPPGDALLETTGRRTGRPVRTPVCDGLDGQTFWLVAQRGRRAGWAAGVGRALTDLIFQLTRAKFTRGRTEGHSGLVCISGPPEPGPT